MAMDPELHAADNDRITEQRPWPVATPLNVLPVFDRNVGSRAKRLNTSTAYVLDHASMHA